MEKAKDNDIEIIPVGQLDEQRRKEMLMRLEEIKDGIYGIEKLETLQVGD